ncbi:hypothetical protein F5J12DRAFT_915123 [Pisolithus orientalis]|uniref:uncharacterized protein n=1 Tax=Pisolithus orientalis TaxID=936130 RepID=UPI00222493DC|nr:uncharacterized protein F5J12DRAFT_915123 [Pisolithus orientalis]KAI5995294.1 hypothetical protein F5J12DRAFT_915123 [Pisolithus orientalis]
MLLHPYFIFDGPDCPQLKRGKDIVGSTFPCLLVQHFQELLMAFGFNWHMAPGEADVELTNLQSYGLIEAVVTPYNDMLLFGMTCIICRYKDILVYSSKDIENGIGLELGDLYLILLMSSVDTEAIGGAAWMLPFAEFMSFISKWCDSICEVLRTDPQQFLGCRHYELACIITEECIEFPDPTVLAMYLLPLTSWLDNGHPSVTIVMSHKPDLTSLVEFCLQHLDWPLDVIQSRLADACAGATIHTLLQLPGNVNGYFNKLLSSPTYKLSVPIQPLATSGEKSDGDPFYDMEIAAVMLEYLRPDLVLGSVCPTSPLPSVELADENVDA